MKIKFLVQTDNKWPLVFDKSLASYKYAFDLNQYDLETIDIKKSGKDYVDVLLDFCYENKLTHVGCVFDDLVFSKLKLPKEKDLKIFISEFNVQYIRLDGRPPGSKKETFKISNINFGLIKKKKYFFSTVLGVFSLKLLEKFKEEGIKSAWDIETVKIDLFSYKYPKFNLKNNCYSPVARTAHYDNLIVKGKPNLFFMIKHKLILNFRESLIKLIKNKISILFNL